MYDSSVSNEHGAQSLSFQEHNPSASVSVVLLHGSLASAQEWNSVVPHLKGYHLLVADLPQHGAEGSASSKIRYSHATAVEFIAALIRTHARGGVAHVVGLSLGGYLALSLAAKYPELILSLFVTGCARRLDQGEGGTALPPWLMKGVVSTLTTLTRPIPIAWMLKLQGWKDMSAVTEELQADMQASSARAGLSAAIIDGLTSSTCTGPDVWKTVGESGVRVCVLAGERQDPVQTTREQGKTLKETGPAKNQTENKAFLVREAMHAWSLSHPALFAEGIDAWIARREMPVGYEEI